MTLRCGKIIKSIYATRIANWYTKEIIFPNFVKVTHYITYFYKEIIYMPVHTRHLGP